MKKILTVGSGSYVGESFKNYCAECYPDEFQIYTLEARGLKPETEMFKSYDTIFYVAGIAHIKETEDNVQLYYKVNCDLAIKVAEKAKEAGVRQFIIMSTMAVYGLSEGIIKKDTKPAPNTHYGKSKFEADKSIYKLRTDKFRVCVLRPPMIYGKGCKGNYQKLRWLALCIPAFPKVDNQRSMLYIGNFCEFLAEIVLEEKSGLFFPQNKGYVITSDMVKRIALLHEKRIVLLYGLNWIRKLPIITVKKVFGTLIYEHVDEITKYDFDESMRSTEV